MIGLSAREQRVELGVAQAVRMLARRLQPHQIDDVDDADLQLGQCVAQQRHRRQHLERRHVARRRHHEIGLAAVVVARPLPAADAGGAVPHGRVHVAATAAPACLPATTMLT